MKKLPYLTMLFFFTALVFFSSCEEKEGPYKKEEGFSPVISKQSSSIFNVGQLETTDVSFELNSSGTPLSALEYFINYKGGESVSIGTINSFPSNVTITAKQAIEALGLEASSVAVGDVFRVSFVGKAQDGRTLRSNKFMKITGSCPSALEGEYTMVTTYVAHDFLADYPSNTMDATITKNAEGNYTSTDFSGGLYGDGPYSTAYNTVSLSSVVFSEVCGDIIWSDQKDDWGDLVMTDGAVNEVNPETGVITISWTCTAYGESGVSVYTPK